MLYVWVYKALYNRVCKCLKLRLWKVEGLEELAIHHLLYELTYFRIFHALFHCVEA